MVPLLPQARPTALLAALALLAGCGGQSPPPSADAGTGAASPPPGSLGSFPDEAQARGLVFHNVSGTSAKDTVLEANGPGVALFDLGDDGDLDVAFSQGLATVADLAAGQGAKLGLFVNESGRFREQAAPARARWWTGLAAGDIDGDGTTDLVAGSFGQLVVFRQEAGALDAGRVVDVRPLESKHASWWTSVALFDADRDGVLDLYGGRYLDFDPAAPPRGELGEPPLTVPCWWKGQPVFCGPRGLPPQPDALLRGTSPDGGADFVDVSATWLPQAPPAFTLGVAPFDADMDGDTDLYVANDSVANQLWINRLDETGRFEELGLFAGVALNPDGEAEAGMGIAIGDVDRDGRFDLAVTNFSGEPTQLYLADAIGFRCASYTLGLAALTRPLLSWGAHLVDFTGDGQLELFTANGHVYPQADRPGTNTRYGQPDSLFALARGTGTVTDLAAALPNSVFAAELGTRGSAVGDIDGDGRADLVLARIDAPAALGMNRLGAANTRLVVRCIGAAAPHPATGRRTPRDGLGTRVVLVVGTNDTDATFALLDEVQTARGFQSASSHELTFGLGRATGYRSLTLLWPSGRVEELAGGPGGRRLTVREGEGIVTSEELK